MSCNCKNNKQPSPPQPVFVKSNNVVEIIDISEPPYTREEIIRAKDYLSSTSKEESERLFVADLLLKNFGDITPEYCGQDCMNQIKNRLNYMESKIIQYETTKV